MFFGGMPFDDFPGHGHPGMRGGGRQREPANTTELYEVKEQQPPMTYDLREKQDEALVDRHLRGGVCRSTRRETDAADANRRR